MSIESFFTLQSLMPGQSNTSAKSTGEASDGIFTTEDGKGFVDLILDYMKAYGEAKDEQIEQEKEAIKLEEFLKGNPEVLEKLEKFSLDGDTDLADVLALNQQAFDETLEAIETQGTITVEKISGAEGAEEISHVFFIDTEQNHRPVLNKIKAIADKIEQFSKDDPAQLVAANLTPEQLTKIQDYIEAVQNGGIPEDEPDVGVFVGLIKLLPPQARPEIIVTGQSVIIAPRQLEVSGKTNSGPANDLAARLNDLTPGDGGEDFTQTLKDLKLTKFENGNSYRTNAAAGQDTAPQPSAPANTTTVQSTAFNLDGSLSTLIDPQNPLSTQLGISSASVNPASASHIANPVTQSYSAGTTHPATQIVSNALQRSAQPGQDTQITLRLDPPELGRIQARLQFGSNKALQTSLTVEQPETYAMLQRDTHSLERALQDMGLDLGDGINLELAEQGFNFDQGNQRGGGHDQGGTGAGGQNGETEEIIQSTMTWRVDPETGHTSYDIWA